MQQRTIDRCHRTLPSNQRRWARRHHGTHAAIRRNNASRTQATRPIRQGCRLGCAPCSHVLSGTTFQWYRTDALPGEPIDLLIVDGPPADTGDSPRYPAGPKLFPRLSSNGAIFIDDAGRPEDVDVNARWRQEFTELIFEINTQEFQKGICTARPIAQKSPQPALQVAG